MGRRFPGCLIVLALAEPALAHAQVALPPRSATPLRVDVASDPILQLRRLQSPFEEFRAVIAAAVQRHPGTEEFQAVTEVARATLSEARERRRPSADFSVNAYRVISREFSNDPENIVERSRPNQRTDALLSVQQTLFDFGAGEARVAAAGAGLRQAAADLESAADRVALAAVAAWYDVFGYRALVTLTEAFVSNQEDLRNSVRERIRQGVSAEGDLARVDSYIALARTRMARYRRLAASAEARFTELTGTPPPASLERAPPPELPSETKDAASLAARRSPVVRSAEAAADAARKEAKAASAERLGSLSAGIDAGRYGVFENERDYDIRGRLTFRQRLLGGVDPRAEQAQARARAAEARADRVREEVVRDAAIAWSDVEALEQQLAAIERNYIAARQSRDVLAERFRAARGSLFDLVAAEDAYFDAAASYVQALTELDAARYILLSRTGRLLAALSIEPAGREGMR